MGNTRCVRADVAVPAGPLIVLRALAGGQIFGEVTGDPPPRVLALHGWARTHADFSAVLVPGTRDDPGEADDDRRPWGAVAPDLPGFGATPAPSDPWGTPEYATRIAELLSDMAEPVVVLGHSFGGRVAVRLAAARPEAVRGLVLTGVPLVAGPGGRRRPPPAYRVVRTLHRLRLVGDARMETARQRYGSADYRAAQGVMRQVLVTILAERYEEDLAAIECPVHLVWGDDDTEVPLAVAEAAASLLGQCQLTVCAGAGHMTPLTAPGPLRRAVQELLA